MSVVVSDLLAENGGQIERGMFPDLDDMALTARLGAYLTIAGAKVADVAADRRDEAVAAYAYHMAFMAVYRRMTTDPADQSLGEEGRTAYLPEQIDAVYVMANEALATFDAILAEGGGTARVTAPSWPAVRSYRGGAG